MKNFNVETLPFFEKQLKRLSKKYPSLKREFAQLIELLIHNPVAGTPVGSNCYKIRMAVESKGKGASGGARVITCVKVVQSTVYLLTIYDKGEQEDISAKDLSSWISQIPSP